MPPVPVAILAACNKTLCSVVHHSPTCTGLAIPGLKGPQGNVQHTAILHDVRDPRLSEVRVPFAHLFTLGTRCRLDILTSNTLNVL